MKNIGAFLRGCELDYIQSATISKCDGEDGLVDDIILDPSACKFDPPTLCGKTFFCREIQTDMKVSKDVATVAAAYQQGARGPNHEFLWHGPNWGANSTSIIFRTPGLAVTLCEGYVH